MDPSSFLSPIFLCALAFLSFAFLIYKHKFSSSASKNLPPGRTGWPVIGESIAFLAASTAGHPETFTQKRMAKYSPKVYKTSLFCEPVAAFCGQAGHKFLFSNEYKLVNAWWPKSVDKVFPLAGKTTSKEESKRMKKILPHFLKPELLQKYIGIMDIVCQRHFALDWDGKQQVTVLPMAKKFTFWVACKVFLSVEDPAYVAKFAGPFNTLATGMVTVPIDIPGTPFNRAIKASKIIQEDILQIIKQRKIELAENRASPTQDILSHMLTSPDGDGQFMTDDDITDKILGLLIGGHDTASGVITYIFKFLAEHPQVYQRVYDEQMEIASSKAPGDLLSWEDLQKMKYSWQVACEVMRLAPPLQGGFREALKEFTFEGYTIPKGWKLYWTVNSTHQNPEYFKDPEKFDPSRFEGSGPAPYTFVPFGGGPRMCPGKEYARLETLVFMHNLMKRYKWEKVIPNEKTTVNPLRAPVHGLPIRVFPLNKTA